MSRIAGQAAFPARPATRPCPVCGAPAPAVSAPGSAPPPGAVRCAACAAVFVDPIPAAALDPDSYDAPYYEAWRARAGARARLWGRRLRLVERREPCGTLLDVGCGDGDFLVAARAAGWSVEGIEFSAEGARRSAARLGRPVAIGDLARATVLRGPFDVVTLWHVLEHLADPGAMLAAARARLRPGGLLAVAVPNLRNLPLRAAYRLARLRPLPLYEPGAREPHLTHFETRTLIAILARHRFAPIEVVPDRCALQPAKRLIDAVAAGLSRLSGRLLTDAIVAFARVPR